MRYTYKKSLMKCTIDNFNIWYKESDFYAIMLSIIFMIPLFIIGIILSLIIDFIVIIFTEI